jgi:glycosyltransferase involved in cell wall biosynthesis
MRVLHLLGSTGWGGAERVACTIHRLALEHGVESRVDAPALPEVLRGYRSECAKDLPGGEREQGYLRWALEARRRKRLVKPDVVHAHLATPGLASAVALIAGSTPLVITFHLLPRTEPWCCDYLHPLRSRSVIRLLLRAKRRLSVVAVSRTDQAVLRDRLGAEGIQAVVNVAPLAPVGAGSYVPEWHEEARVRLLSVGRLHTQKGFDRMLEALADPLLRSIPWHWTIVGGGEEQEALEEDARRLGVQGRVTFAGAQPAHAAFAHADLVLCPSRFEGMPLVPLEALAAGTPVLLSRIAPHLELLEDAADSFLPEDTAAWPRRLAELLTDQGSLERLHREQSSRYPRDPHEQFIAAYMRIYESTRAL